MLILLLLPQGEKKNRILSFPHPPKPCLQSCHPVADRLSGVAARRGRRFGGRKDVRRHPEGLAETGLPPATRGKRRACRTDPAVFTPTGRRMCLCGTQGGGRASRGVRGVFPGSRNAGGGHQPVHNPRLRREIEVAGKNRRTGRRKVSPLLPLPRQLPAPRPTPRLNHDAKAGVGGRVAGGHGISSPLGGRRSKISILALAKC